jgi:hypothetical protein
MALLRSAYLITLAAKLIVPSCCLSLSDQTLTSELIQLVKYKTLLALEWVSHMLWSQEGHRPRLQLPSGCASNPLPGKAFGARPNAGSPRLRVGPNLFSSSDRFPYASENAAVGRATSTPKHCAKRAPHPRPLHLDVPTPNPEAPNINLNPSSFYRIVREC